MNPGINMQQMYQKLGITIWRAGAFFSVQSDGLYWREKVIWSTNNIESYKTPSECILPQEFLDVMKKAYMLNEHIKENC